MAPCIRHMPAFPSTTFLPAQEWWASKGFLLVRRQTPSSGKAPFGVTNDPLDSDSTRYFPLATVPDRSSLNERLESQQLRQHCWVRTSTLGAIDHLFSTSPDARLFGGTGSKVESGQSGLQRASPSQARDLRSGVIDSTMLFC